MTDGIKKMARGGCEAPAAWQVKAVRESLQMRLGIGITAAQDVCAEALCTSRRSFQQWERGERAMHPAFFELLRTKIGDS